MQTLHQPYDNPRIPGPGNAVDGSVRWSPRKSLWLLLMYAGSLLALFAHLSVENLAVFVVTTAITICFGHSLGMHRLLIHRSYRTYQWLENTMVWLGTLVGLGGPCSMTRTHDFRDWAQKQPYCHDYFGHRQPMLKDAWWQMHCDLQLAQPPEFVLEERIENNRFYQRIDLTHEFQQILVAIPLFLIGGWSWVLWGICMRVSISVLGHWLIGYFAHNQGHQDWIVDGASVQGHNVAFTSLITFGECWHNNHHAFPGSAKLGFLPGQWDPGWWVLKALAALGLVTDIKTPNLPTTLRGEKPCLSQPFS